MDAGWATMLELQTRLTASDVLNACDALDALEAARAKKKG